MIKKLAFIFGLSIAIGANAQLDVDVNKNYMTLGDVGTSEVGERMTEQHVGVDVDSKGNIIFAYTTDMEGKGTPIIVKYNKEDGYSENSWRSYNGFKSKELINEIKVLNDDWIVVAGMGFTIFVNEDLDLQYALDVSTTESFRDADFMEIDQTPDGKIVVLYSYNYENARDELGMLVVDRAADDFYYAKIGYTGDWDGYKKDGGTAKSFEMAAVSNDYCVVGFDPQRNDEDEAANAYLVVDINKVVNAGDAAKVDAVVKYGHFGSTRDWFKDMTWDKENNRLYVMEETNDGMELTKMKVNVSGSSVGLSKEDSEDSNPDKWKNSTSQHGTGVLTYFSKNGYSPKLVVGGYCAETSGISHYNSPNLNVFSGASLSQTSGAGRCVTNSIYDRDGSPIRNWKAKEVKYIGKSLASEMNGNYKDAFAVLVYEPREERAKLILVDVSYMGL